MAENVVNSAENVVNLSAVLPKIGVDSTNSPCYTCVITNPKGIISMTDNEKELINIIRNSEYPDKVAEYFFNLFLDYLRTVSPSQGTPSAYQEESA